MPDADPPPHRRLPRQFAALLLLALAACAVPPDGPPGAPTGGPPVAVAAPPVTIGPAGQEPPDKPPPTARTAADIAGPACVDEHRAVIDEALAVARQRVDEAARFALAQPDHPHLRRWFGTTPATEVADRLRRTGAQLAQPATFKLLCNDPPNCQGSRMAFASVHRSIIGLCPAFFRARMEGFDTRWGVLVHEASHLAAGTQDHAYGPTAAQILAKDDPARAALNADSYEYFVESLPR